MSWSGNRVSGGHTIWIIEFDKLYKKIFPNLAAGYGVTLGWLLASGNPETRSGIRGRSR